MAISYISKNQMIDTIPTVAKTKFTINGINLILKYQPDAEFSTTTDRLYFGAYCGDKMTPEEQTLMEEWGWFEEYESWTTTT